MNVLIRKGARVIHPSNAVFIQIDWTTVRDIVRIASKMSADDFPDGESYYNGVLDEFLNPKKGL